MAYAQIASGRIDIGIDAQFDIHDYLSFVPIIQGAGGVISDWSGGRLTRQSNGKLLAAGDKRILEQALRVLDS